MLIEPHHPSLSIARQCELIGLARSSDYWSPVPAPKSDLTLMRLIDECYMRMPFFGSRQMTTWLCREATRSTASGYSA